MWSAELSGFAKQHGITLDQAHRLRCTAEHRRARQKDGPIHRTTSSRPAFIATGHGIGGRLSGTRQISVRHAVPDAQAKVAEALVLWQLFAERRGAAAGWRMTVSTSESAEGPRPDVMQGGPFDYSGRDPVRM